MIFKNFSANYFQNNFLETHFQTRHDRLTRTERHRHFPRQIHRRTSKTRFSENDKKSKKRGQRTKFKKNETFIFGKLYNRYFFDIFRF